MNEHINKINKFSQTACTYLNSLVFSIVYITYLCDSYFRHCMTLFFLGLIDMAITALSAIGEILKINKLCIYGSLKVSEKACIGIDADITLFGVNFKLNGKMIQTSNSTFLVL